MSTRTTPFRKDALRAAVCAAALLMPAAARPAAPEGEVRLVAAGPGFARILFEGPRPGEVAAAPGPDGQVPARLAHLFVSGGLVGLPLDGEATLTVLEARPAGRLPAEACGPDLPCSGPASLGEPGFLRRQRVAPIAFGPSLTAGGAIVYDRVLAEVRFPPAAGGDGRREGAFEPSYAATILNYDQARPWRRPKEAARRPAQAGVLPSDGMFRLTVRSDGLYRVTGRDLVEAGAALAGVDPSRIRVLYGGGLSLGLAHQPASGVTLRPLPAVVEDGGDGRFDEADYVLFYGQAPERWDYDARWGYFWRKNLFTRDNVYWLDLAAAEPGLRAEVRDVAPAQAPGAAFDRYRERLHEEDERLILRQLVGIDSGYDWYWEAFSGNARNYSFVVDDAVPGVAAFVRVALWGWTNEAHLFDLHWNDVDLGRFRFTKSALDTLMAVADGGAREGLNQLGLFHRDTNSTRLDWYEVEFVRRLVARGGELVFDWPGAADGGAEVDTATGLVAEFRLSGFDVEGGPPRLLELASGRELVGAAYDAATGSLVFQDWYSGKGRPPRYAVAQPSRWKRPPAIVRDSQQRLRSANNGAEYVAISHADFLPAARRLADWRGADDRFGPPLKAMAIDVQDVYDEFSGGLVDPMAIRAFVNYAVENWAVEPVFITLVGDGTYDYKNNSGASHANWIPPYQDGESMYDEWYVRVAGGDILPDLAIGRLTVQTPAEADAVVDKILRYDQRPASGPWRSRVLLVADDVTNPQIPAHFESYFLTDAEFLARRGLPDDLDLTKLYIGSYPVEGRTKPRARAEFLRRLNEGELILTYLGHGNPEVLAHEQIFLVSRDLASVDNGWRLPFIYTAASQVGVFDDPARESMPEAFLKLPDRGAIGFISATRVGFHNSNMVLARKFHEQMYRSGRDHVPVGLALMEAKQQVEATDDFRINIQRYSLIGDAAQRLARPLLSVALDLPDSLEALQEVEVDGRVLDASGAPASGYRGEAFVRVFDSAASSQLEGLPYTQLGAAIYRGRVPVADGRFHTRFRVPKDITYRANEGRISAFVTGADGQEPAFGARPNLVLSGTAEGVVPDSDGPTITLAFAGHGAFGSGDYVSARPVLAAVLEDAGGINITGETGHEIELRLDDEVIPVTEYFTSRGDYRVGDLEYPLGELEPGEHSIRLKAWDAFNNSSAVEARFLVPEAAAAALTNVLFHPNPTRDGAGSFSCTLAATARSLQIKVFALSGRLVGQVEADAVVGYNQVSWSPPEALANGTYLYRLEAQLDSGERPGQDGWIQVLR